MMRLFLWLVVLALYFSPASAQSLRQTGILRLLPSVVERDATVRTVELLSSKNQSAGKFRAADVASCLKVLVEQIAPDDRPKAIIIAKNEHGLQLVFSLPELLPDVAKLSPLLVYRKVVGELVDTAHIHDTPGQPGKINTKDIDAYLERAVQERIKLQFPDVKRVTALLRQPVSLIFPTDASPARWMNDVETLTVAIIE